MAKKYEFTGETKVWFGFTLHRIRAVISFGKVEAGELGGWIEEEENLSHYDSAWVCDNALVYDNARVYDNAWVCDNALVYDNAWVCDNARVCGNARVCDNALVCGNALVCDNALVCGNALVYDNARVWQTNHYLCIGPIGSRFDFTTFFRAKGKEIRVKCGCFHGDIDTFALKVQATHGDNQHAKAYMAAVELAKLQIDLTEEDPEVPKRENDNG